MSIEELNEALDNLDTSDPERAHGEADALILAALPASTRAAYERLAARAPWWGSA